MKCAWAGTKQTEPECAVIFNFFKKRFLFIFREREGREKETERNINWLLLMLHQLGAGLKPRHVP